MANSSYRRHWRRGTRCFPDTAENYPREDGSAKQRPPERTAGHQTGGEETDTGPGDSFVYLGGSVWRREDGERGMYIYFEEHRPSERVESS